MEAPTTKRISRRTFVRSLLATGAVVSGGVVAPAVVRSRAASSDAPLVADEDYPVAVDARPVALVAGDLLVTDQANSTIFHVRDGAATPVVNVATWSHSFLFDTAVSLAAQRLWVSLTGLKAPGSSYYFGLRGVGQVLEIDLATGALTRAFQSPDMIDPAGLLLSEASDALYVADFNSFGTPGQLLRLALADGSLSVVSTGGHLTTPVGLNPAGSGSVVVGVANMPEVGPDGGSIVTVDLDTGRQTLVHEHPEGHGELIGALRLPDGTFIGTRSEWPGQDETALFSTAGGGAYQDVFRPAPGFLSSGISWSGDGVWVAEAARRELLHVRPDGTVTARVQVPGERDGTRIPEACKSLESVRVVA